MNNSPTCGVVRVIAAFAGVTRLGPRASTGLAIFLVTMCALSPSSVCGMETGDMVRAVISRSQAITSGRLTYTFSSRGFRGWQALTPRVFPEATTSFFGSSWAERTKGSHVVRINHDGYFLEFVQTPQPDGSVRSGATLLPRRSLASRTELNAPPIFAGSFWFRRQLQYVEQHVDEFRPIGQTTVNKIPTTVLELAVSAKDHREAFHVYSPSLESGGAIRLYVARELGYVLPRIEFRTPSERIVQSYDAIDFKEVAPGIYFPKRVWTAAYAADGASRYRAEFVTRCELVNQPIPQEDFVVEVPIGTQVQDAREAGSVITFQVRDDSSSLRLATHGAVSESIWPSLGFLNRWHNAVIVGLVIGSISSISLLLAARNQRYRGYSSR